MKRTIVPDILICFLILLFVYAAVSKLLDYQKFTVQLGQSPMITNYAGFLGWFVPGFELLISGLLITPRTRIVGLYAFISLMTMFTVYITLASRFSDYVPCSCGGIIQNLTWTQHLIFNIGFIVLGVIALSLSPVKTFKARDMNSNIY